MAPCSKLETTIGSDIITCGVSTMSTPKLPGLRAAAEAARLQRIAAQNEAYCAKWRMGPGTPMHSDCLSDLGRLYTEIQDQHAEESEF